jgi:hypothetical protein
MKKKIVLTTLGLTILLTGCSISTPKGTLNISLDESNTSDQVVYTDDNGESAVIHTENVSNYVDQLLDNVALPSGTSTVDLKGFINDNLNSLGIDLNSLDFSNTEEVDKAEQSIKDTLESQGVDTSNLDINLEDYVESDDTKEEVSDTDIDTDAQQGEENNE